MAAGTKSGKFTLTGSAQTVDVLIADTSTYSYLAIKCLDRSVFVGPSGVTINNGYHLAPTEELIIPVSVTGASVGLIGPGIVDIFGIATA